MGRRPISRVLRPIRRHAQHVWIMASDADKKTDGAEGARIISFTGSVSGAEETWAGNYSVETYLNPGKRIHLVPAARSR